MISLKTALKALVITVFITIVQGCDMGDSQFEQDLKQGVGDSQKFQMVLEKYFPKGKALGSSLDVLRASGFKIYHYTYEGYGKWPSEKKPYKSISDRTLAGVHEPSQQVFHAEKTIDNAILGNRKVTIGIHVENNVIVKQGGSVVADSI